MKKVSKGVIDFSSATVIDLFNSLFISRLSRANSTVTPVTTISKLSFFAFLYNVKNISGSIQSSESTKPTYSPVTNLNPTFRVAPGLPLRLYSTLIRSSLTAYSSAISPLLSVEPSSTTMISSSRNVWLQILSRQAERYFSALKTGTMTETNGFSVISLFIIVVYYFLLFLASDDDSPAHSTIY